MPSPFPGMDPYLEVHWPDVQASLVVHGADLLNRSLPDDLVARVDARIAIDSETIVGIGYQDPSTERFINILGAQDERVVTVIEFVSPANKRGKGLEAFIASRAASLAAGVNVVEVDLTRGGDWKALLGACGCPEVAETPYRAVARVAGQTDVCLYPIPLGQPLPTIAIPLRAGETPAELPLGILVRKAYDNSRYGSTVDYSRDPKPPLEKGDAEWADRLLREAGRRK